MHLEDGLQPPGALVVIGMHRRGVFRHLKADESAATVVVDNDCRDPNTNPHRHQYVCEMHKGKQVVRIDGFGGAVKFSPYCPRYNPAVFDAAVEEFTEAVSILDSFVIGLSSHGEHCGLCTARGITVAQRIFLTVDARQRLRQALEPSFPGVKIYTTYHRRYTKRGEEFQKTRVVDHGHELFQEVPMDDIMRMSDMDVVRMIAPDLLERVLVS